MPGLNSSTLVAGSLVISRVLEELLQSLGYIPLKGDCYLFFFWLASRQGVFHVLSKGLLQLRLGLGLIDR